MTSLIDKLLAFQRANTSGVKQAFVPAPGLVPQQQGAPGQSPGSAGPMDPAAMHGGAPPGGGAPADPTALMAAMQGGGGAMPPGAGAPMPEQMMDPSAAAAAASGGGTSPFDAIMQRLTAIESQLNGGGGAAPATKTTGGKGSAKLDPDMIRNLAVDIHHIKQMSTMLSEALGIKPNLVDPHRDPSTGLPVSGQEQPQPEQSQAEQQPMIPPVSGVPAMTNKQSDAAPVTGRGVPLDKSAPYSSDLIMLVSNIINGH